MSWVQYEVWGVDEDGREELIETIAEGFEAQRANLGRDRR